MPRSSPPSTAATGSTAAISWRAASSGPSSRHAFCGSAGFSRTRRSSGTLTLAVATPADGEAVRAVELALQRAVTIAVATADDIEAALVTRLELEEPRLAGAPEAAAAADDDLDDLRDLAGGAPVVRAVDEFLRLAVEQRATDLHVEPFSTGLQVRLRIDGLLKPIPAPPMSMAKGILSRLKIMAGLNITERRMPQDGRARVLMNGSEIDLRVATMPTMHGESAVVRLLRKGSRGRSRSTSLAFRAAARRSFAAC